MRYNTDKSMYTESLTPQNTTIILLDFATGFGNIVRSHTLAVNKNNVLLLAQTALSYESGFVVTNGPAHKTLGLLYPELVNLLGTHPVITRGGMFNAFLFKGFADAVAATGRKNLVVAGLTTEGCVLQTVMGGLRLGYKMHVVVDTASGQSKESHDAAIQRMIQAGTVPLTAFSLAGEFQVDQDRPDVKKFIMLTNSYNPEMTLQNEFYQDAQEDEKENTNK